MTWLTVFASRITGAYRLNYVEADYRCTMFEALKLVDCRRTREIQVRSILGSGNVNVARSFSVVLRVPYRRLIFTGELKTRNSPKRACCTDKRHLRCLVVWCTTVRPG